MSSTPFATAERALRLTRRCFSKEIKAILDESKSDDGLSKTDFENKKEYFNETCGNVVTSTKGCIKIFDDDYEDKEEEIIELNYQLDVLKEQLRQFLELEVEIKKKISDIDRSEKERQLKCDDLISSVSSIWGQNIRVFLT